MKRYLLVVMVILFAQSAIAQDKRKAGSYVVPDSVKASGVYMDVVISQNEKRPSAVLSVSGIRLIMQERKGKKSISFKGVKYEKALVTPPGVTVKNRVYNWDYDWKFDQKYTLLVMKAIDSASKSSIYSGYVFLPEGKWKLIGTFHTPFDSWLTGFSATASGKKNSSAQFTNRWLLRQNNTWKALDSQTTKPPVLRPLSNIDSVAQQQTEENALRARLPMDSAHYKEGIFFKVMKEGSGKAVNVTDTVVVNYKGWLFSNNEVFDETKDKPATFPLARLIRGWQVGVPQCRVGGKIRLYIPSGSAYGIRTFALDIPPNSTLVFDVEVLEAKEK